MADEELIERQRQQRADIVDLLSCELLGPYDGPEERIGGGRPSSRYLLGRLAPVGTAVPAEEDEGGGDAGGSDDDSDSGYASPISMAMNPSSLGISVTVATDVDELEVVVSWGTYSKEQSQVEGRDGKMRTVTEWVREPHRHPIDEDSPRLLIDVRSSDKQQLEPGVWLEWLVRDHDKRRAVSVFLVNRIVPTNPDFPEDDEWLFQPEIRLSALGAEPADRFRSRSLDDLDDFEALDNDKKSDELLYRERPEYAVGHGCAADWASEGASGATEAWTVLIPTFELPRIDPREGNEPGLDMRKLGGDGPDGVPAAQLEALLQPLADGYATWIKQLEVRASSLDSRLAGQAHEHLEACKSIHERMIEGIELLAGSDDDGRLARESFCFANRAMALQRSRSVCAQRRRRGADPGRPEDVPTRWRPFQLAFVLVNLPPLVDRGHADRTTADLLWFPTGGGKTEAYLGLTAFVLALRRRRPALPGRQVEGGVSVLMRYTLRLLTVQQFQRATALVCACEYLRASEGVWGTEPFSIGLWVGTSVTPNRYDDGGNNFFGDGAKQGLAKWKDDKRIKGGTPVQLLHCPWCGAALDHDSYDADDYSEQVKIFCSDDECDFHQVNDWGIDGIPAHVVDDQVFHRLPSLVIATVDKFAQMAWNGRVQSLFGSVQRRCERHGYISTGEPHSGRHNADPAKHWPKAEVHDVEPFEPPDLIIQDELHLISGPLGTMVGLYETAVDALASTLIGDDRVPPKVVASTATIRRADEQVGALFNRSLSIFPPSGLDATDSWFGTEVSTVDAPGRLYLGIFAPGKSVKTALVRVYGTLLSRAKKLHEDDPEAADAYMTLVGYFNSLRELGGAVRLAEDDIPSRINVLNRRVKEDWARRILFERHELTSNQKADQVPAILDKLERRFPPGDAPKGKYPVDVLFASNMISVGVDIDRLGLMVVNGQPKTTAEYIQATSRVGRQTPGLVVTVYNWTRPRDISHYERFRSYHGALYRSVEPTSVTPFSSRARDKGLEGVLTSLVRQGNPAMSSESAAENLDVTDPWLAEVLALVSRRAAAVADADTGAETRAELQGAVDKWVGLLGQKLPYSQRGYGAKKVDSTDKWLLDGQEDLVRQGAYVAPGSLREVESEVHVHLLDKRTASGSSSSDSEDDS